MDDAVGVTVLRYRTCGRFLLPWSFLYGYKKGGNNDCMNMVGVAVLRYRTCGRYFLS